MIKLEGIVLNVFTSRAAKTKKAKHSTTATRCKFWRYGTSQWWCENELFTLSVENYRDFKDYLN